MVVFRIKTDWILKRQGATGVEPVTSRSAVECSATELYPQRWFGEVKCCSYYPYIVDR